MDDYACEYDFITRCRFFAARQQEDCAGYPKGHKGHCPWWRNHGGELYHCTHPEAQAAAIDEFKKTHMEPQ